MSSYLSSWITVNTCAHAYGLGTILAGRADGNIAWLYLSYGVLGGIGLGLGYIVPLATLIRSNIGSIYGLLLTAWGFAGVLGPTLFARIREATAHYTEALNLIAVVMLAGAVIPFFVRSTRGAQLQPAIKPS